jgi:hypothetical protein
VHVALSVLSPPLIYLFLRRLLSRRFLRIMATFAASSIFNNVIEAGIVFAFRKTQRREKENDG